MADFDFSVAMTIAEFYDDKDVKSKKWTVSDCHSESGDTFPALKLTNGGTTDAGRPAVTCFALCKKLQEQGFSLTKEWVRENRADLRLIDPEDVNTADGHDAKFGIIYLDNQGADDWDDWED